MAKKKTMKSGGICSCNCSPASMAWVLLGCLTLGLAVFLFVKGLKLQWNAGDWWAIVLYGLASFVWCVAKKLKWKGVGSCKFCA